MDQVHVQVVELQVGERLAEGRDDVGFGVLVVPELAGDPELLARDAAGDDLAQGEADAVFVAVDAGAIEVAVAHGGGAFDGRGDFVRGDVVAAEGAQSDGRHPGAGVESSFGDERGVDAGWVEVVFMRMRPTSMVLGKSRKCQALSFTLRHGWGRPGGLPCQDWQELVFALDAHAVEAAVYEDHRDREEDRGEHGGEHRALLGGEVDREVERPAGRTAW